MSSSVDIPKSIVNTIKNSLSKSNDTLPGSIVNTIRSSLTNSPRRRNITRLANPLNVTTSNVTTSNVRPSNVTTSNVTPSNNKRKKNTPPSKFSNESINRKFRQYVNDKTQDGLTMIRSITNFHNYLFFFFLFLMLIYYIGKKLSKDSENCNIIQDNRTSGTLEVNEYYSITDLISNGYLNGNLQIKGTSYPYNYKLKDFYIKTAYNCFCSGNFKNDFVNSCAMKNCASFGVRALDMQIYSKNQTPIVGTSIVNSNTYKQSYNDITLKNALSSIQQTYFVNSTFSVGDGDTAQNNLKTDPLFLILRLYYGNNNKQSFQDSDTQRKDKQFEFYNKIYNILLSTFANDKFASVHLRNKYQNTYDRTIHTPNISMADTQSKIFIFVILNDVNYETIQKSNLDKIVDLYGTDFNAYRINEIFDSNSAYDINKYKSQDQLSFCMPALSGSSENYDFIPSMKKGTQFIGMNFQTYDTYLNSYNNFFIEQYGTGQNVITSPYIKKPDHMIRFPLDITLDISLND